MELGGPFGLLGFEPRSASCVQGRLSVITLFLSPALTQFKETVRCLANTQIVLKVFSVTLLIHCYGFEILWKREH